MIRLLFKPERRSSISSMCAPSCRCCSIAGRHPSGRSPHHRPLRMTLAGIDTAYSRNINCPGAVRLASARPSSDGGGECAFGIEPVFKVVSLLVSPWRYRDHPPAMRSIAAAQVKRPSVSMSVNAVQPLVFWPSHLPPSLRAARSF